MRNRYTYYKPSGKAVRIVIGYDFGRYSIYIDDKYYGYGDTRAEADEIVRDYAELRGLSETKPKKKTSRSAGKQAREIPKCAQKEVP